MECYFDNSATTRVFDEARAVADRAMEDAYGNPSSRHRKGLEAELLLRDARRTIADTLKVKEQEIVFTSGGTESNNLALVGAALSARRRGKHIITTGIEHASVYQPLGFLAEEGYELTVLPVDRNGLVSPEDLANALRPDTILVSVMYVNNEIGAVEPIRELASVIREKNPDTWFHVDAIQAYGKMAIRPKREGIDMLSASGHKIHAPKGTGFLYVDGRVRLHPLMLGGGQQKDMRSGTENVPGYAALAKAAGSIYQNLDGHREHLYGLRERLIAGLLELPGVTVNGFADRRNAPHIVSASFEGVRAEVLLHALEDRGVYVSSGSACSSNHPGISGTLKGIGLRRDLLDSTLRFSFGAFNAPEEVDYALDVLGELLPVLRKYKRG